MQYKIFLRTDDVVQHIDTTAAQEAAEERCEHWRKELHIGQKRFSKEFNRVWWEPDAPLTFDTFADYIALFPEAERYRNWLTRNNKRIVIVKASPFCNGLPGGYYWATTSQYQGKWSVHVTDDDDGNCSLYDVDEATANEWLQTLKGFAPFIMGDLTAFGFKF